MERKYLEITEQLTSEERIEQEPEMLRQDVTEKTEKEIKEEARKLKDLIKNPKCCLHSHYHSIKSEENRPCKIEELDLTEEKEDGLK